MSIINMRPPRIAFVLTIIAAAFHWLFFRGERMRYALPWSGMTLGLIGFFLMMWAWWLFKQRDLAVCPTARTASMITHGPYRFTRNPMYLGMFLLMLGPALYFGTPPFYLAAIGYFVTLNHVFCQYEETKLANAFGGEYLQYRERVRRWL